MIENSCVKFTFEIFRKTMANSHYVDSSNLFRLQHGFIRPRNQINNMYVRETDFEIVAQTDAIKEG